MQLLAACIYISYLVIVKKLVVIFVLVSFLCNHTELGQLCKLPQFYIHFQDHKALNPAITVFEFLKIHYCGHEVDNDYAKDMKLPFKTQLSHWDAPIITKADDASFRFNTIVYPRTVATFFSYKSNLYNKYVSGLFRPPSA